MLVRLVNYFADTQFSNFLIEYLHETKKFAKPILPIYMKPSLNLLSKIIIAQKSCDTVPLNGELKMEGVFNWKALSEELNAEGS